MPHLKNGVNAKKSASWVELVPAKAALYLPFFVCEMALEACYGFMEIRLVKFHWRSYADQYRLFRKTEFNILKLFAIYGVKL